MSIAYLNIFIRGVGFVGRFLLTLYLVKYLTLTDVGWFGLIAGVISSAPVILGWGLNYYMTREIVGKPREISGVMMRDRLIITVITMSLFCLIVGPLALRHHMLSSVTIWLLSSIILLIDSIGSDLFTAQVNLEQAFTANTLFFVRNSLWIFPLVTLGFFEPKFRSLEVVLLFWLAGLIFYFIALIWSFRDWPWLTIIKTPIDWTWIQNHLKRGWFIYLSDIGNTGSIYLDRYIIAFFVGLQAVGIYICYLQITGSILTLVFTGMLQPAYPKFIRYNNQKNMIEWKKIFNETRIKSILVYLILSVIAYITFPQLLVVLHKKEIASQYNLFGFMLLAYAIRICSEVLSLGLSSLHMDDIWAYTNIGSMLLILIFESIGAYCWGLWGIVFALMLAQGVILFIRQHYISNFIKLKVEPELLET